MTSVDEHGPPATPARRPPHPQHPPRADAPPAGAPVPPIPGCGDRAGTGRFPGPDHPPAAGVTEVITPLPPGRVSRRSGLVPRRPECPGGRRSTDPPVPGAPSGAGGPSIPPVPGGLTGPGGPPVRPGPGPGGPRRPSGMRPPRSRPVLDDRPTAPVPTTRPAGVPRTKRAVVDERARAIAQGLPVQRPPVQRPPVRYHGPTPEELRLDAAGPHGGPPVLHPRPRAAHHGAGDARPRRRAPRAPPVPHRRRDHGGVRARPAHAARADAARRPVGPARHPAVVAHPRRRRDRAAGGRADLDGRHRPDLSARPADRPAHRAARARRRGRRGAVPDRRRTARVRCRARQLPAAAARAAVPVAQRRHSRRRGDRQGTVERAAGRQRRRDRTGAAPGPTR